MISYYIIKLDIILETKKVLVSNNKIYKLTSLNINNFFTL